MHCPETLSQPLEATDLFINSVVTLLDLPWLAGLERFECAVLTAPHVSFLRLGTCSQVCL